MHHPDASRAHREPRLGSWTGNEDRIAIDAGWKLHARDVIGRRRGGGRMLMDEDGVVEHFIERPRLWSRHEEALVMAAGWDAVLGRGLV